MGEATKSLAAEIEAVLSGRGDERVARILCDVWGYQWDGDPDVNENVIPERAGGDYDRPDKATLIAGAVAVRSQIIAPLIAALQSRGFEDGARWRRTGKMSRPAFGSGGTDEWFRPSDGLIKDFPVGFEPNLGVYYGLTFNFAGTRAALTEQEKGDA